MKGTGETDHSEDKVQDVVHSEMVARSHSKESNIPDYDSISYGQNGIRGLLASPYVVGAAFLASLGGFSFGYDQGVISLILTMDQFQIGRAHV